MSHNEKSHQFFPISLLSSATALKFFTALVALGTVLLHLIGAVRHRQYLTYWGVNSDLFPKSVDWIIINGYYGVFDRFFAIVVAVKDSLLGFIGASLILSLYVFILRSPTGRSGKMPAWFLRQPEWVERLLRHLLLTAMFLVAFSCAMLFLMAFMSVPAALGETAGIAAAEREAEHYRKGCAASKARCVQLKKDGEIIAVGFVLDSSQSHIAILDDQSKKARVISLEKIELISMHPISAHSAASLDQR